MSFTITYPISNSRTQREGSPHQFERLRDLAESYELEQLAQLSPDLALREARPLLAHLSIQHAALIGAGKRELARQNPAQPYVALSCTGDSGYALQLFVWPAGASTQIHDHSSWGAFCAVMGRLREDRFVRLDDGSRPNHAHIRTNWSRTWRRDDGASTLMPAAGGIHRVSNPSRQPVFSVHLYGPPSEVDGRDYDPLRDYVCDRLADDALV